MKAVVMAGGEGSRLRPLTSSMPKPLLPVAGRPIMEHILLHLRRHQLRDVVATVQYMGASIRNYFGDGSEQGVALTYSVEDSPLGTAGSVMLARQQLNEPFVVISGDSLTDIDLGAAARFHRERKAIATIVLKPVPNPLEYGVVVVDEGGAVQRFIEKPSWGEVISDLANTGIYVLDPAVFDFFRPGEPTDWSGDVFPKLLKEGEPVFGWVAAGYWEDVGSHAAYVKANIDCLEGRVKVQIPAARKGDSLWIHEEAEVSPGARIDAPALICAGAKVRAGAWINGPCVIGGYTTVDSGAKVSNSITWDHTYIGENCRLRGTVVCRAVTVKNGCLLEEGSVVGSEVVIGNGSTVHPNVRIWPNKEVEPGAVVHESIIWAGSWKRGLFTSYGLTGLTNVEFTPEFGARLGASVGALAPKGTEIAISRDYTRSARMIHRAVISGMISSGANATDLSVLPAPVRHPDLRRPRPRSRQAHGTQAREPVLPRGHQAGVPLRDGTHHPAGRTDRSLHGRCDRQARPRGGARGRLQSPRRLQQRGLGHGAAACPAGDELHGHPAQRGACRDRDRAGRCDLSRPPPGDGRDRVRGQSQPRSVHRHARRAVLPYRRDRRGARPRRGFRGPDPAGARVQAGDGAGPGLGFTRLLDDR